MRQVLFAMALLTLLSACASSGVQVTQEQAQSFQPGKSTYVDVTGALGPPTTVATSSTGQKIATYSYASVSSRPQNFIPYIGPLVSSYDTKSSAVSFVFDNRDVLVSFNSVQGNQAMGANLTATPAR